MPKRKRPTVTEKTHRSAREEPGRQQLTLLRDAMLAKGYASPDAPLTDLRGLPDSIIAGCGESLDVQALIGALYLPGRMNSERGKPLPKRRKPRK